MPRHLCFSLLALLGGAVAARADQAADAIVAAMKLSSDVSYSWTTTIVQNAHTAEIRGKTSTDGYSLLTFTGFSAGSGASATKSGDSVNTVFRGDSKYVVERNGNWVLATDTSTSVAPADTSKGNSGGNIGTTATRGGRRGGRGGGGGIGGTGTSGQRRGSGGGGGQEPASPSPATTPKLPLGVNLPHEELAIVASNFKEMHFADGVVNGTLTDWGADQLLMPPGWTQSPPDEAAGTFQLWIKDGAVTKYELKLTAATGPGGVTVKGGVAETITVELTDVGATTVTVPPAAKLKLGV